jgi:GTP-binding protein
MADGCLLLVDAFEGPMPQTTFVLQKAFEAGPAADRRGNQQDRPPRRPAAGRRHDEVSTCSSSSAPTRNRSTSPPSTPRRRWATRRSIRPSGRQHRRLFDTILKHVPAPEVDPGRPLQMLITTLDYNDYVGRIGIGRVFAGTARAAEPIAVIHRDGTQAREKIGELHVFDGLGRQKVEAVVAGDICAVVGLDSVDIGNTIAAIEGGEPLPLMRIDEPTLHMTFRVNDSPFCGQSGKFLTSRHLRDRLEKELERNVALRVSPGASPEEFHVSGRGLLHLSVLIENMRREGYELQVGKPKVIFRELDNKKTEPIELCSVDVPNEHVGAVMEAMGGRRGVCETMEPRGESTHLEFTVPSRGLIGLRNRLLTATNGTIQMHHRFYEYEFLRGAIPGRALGVMVASEAGNVTAYALDNLRDRGDMFVGPTTTVYEGQIVGEHCRDNDIPVNVCKGKKLTNVRAASADKTVVLKPPREITLEIALEFIEDDELVEVTPDAIRLRKRFLKESDRKKAARGSL